MKITDYIFNSIGVPSYRKYLDLSSFRHKLVSDNISNISTPGYKAKDIEFTDEFNKANGTSGRLQLTSVRTHAHHLAVGTVVEAPPRIREEKLETGAINSVNMESEIASMTQNELLFSVGAALLKRKFDGLRNAITSK